MRRIILASIASLALITPALVSPAFAQTGQGADPSSPIGANSGGTSTDSSRNAAGHNAGTGAEDTNPSKGGGADPSSPLGANSGGTSTDSSRNAAGHNAGGGAEGASPSTQPSTATSPNNNAKEPIK